MPTILHRFAFAGCALGIVGAASAQTFGNTTPFETVSSHSPNYVLGVQVAITQPILLGSFGMIYGMSGQPPATNAIFALYSSNANNLPGFLIAKTNTVHLSAAQTYDNIPFTTTPAVQMGNYWMMALYQSNAAPRMSVLDQGSLVAYWSNPFGSGMPNNAPAASTYTGQNFNYWVNAVPEPATVIALGLGAIAAARRRRR